MARQGLPTPSGALFYALPQFAPLIFPANNFEQG